MRKVLKYLGGILLIAVLAAAWTSFRIYQEINKRWNEDPLVWESDIVEIETATKENPLLENAVVFVGSSSIRFWDTLAQDMSPIPVMRRGFGGAKLNDLVYYADRLVSVHRPLAVVVFAGSNDITPGDTKTAQQLLASYQAFVAKVRTDNPTLPIYFIAITSSARRWEMRPQVQQANAAIRNYIKHVEGLHYIDINPLMLNSEGEPNDQLYRFDKLHLSEEGYKVWASTIRIRLLRDFPQF